MKALVRSTRGSMLCLMVCLIALIFVPIIMLICRMGPFAVSSDRAQSAVEAAAKVAATDLSRIVIDDPIFGYVSLSNHAPLGKATIASDGESLPVTGINVLVSTLRENAIIAEELQNETMINLVDEDHLSLQSTIKNLNAKLYEALSDETRKKECTDSDGKTVDPVEDVKTFLAENLPPNLHLRSVKLTLGWLRGGSETITPIPQPTQLAQVKTKDVQAGKYLAFRNLPVGHRSFSFAGLDSQTHLVSTHKFQEADSKHICSIVKLECILITTEQPHCSIKCVACCQPYSKADLATRGAMTLRFSGRPIPGLLSWNEFLASSDFQDNKITTFDVIGGDYPFEKTARMQESQSEPNCDTAQQFAEHLYFWLRNGRSRPRIDAILSMMNESFQPYTNEVYTYEFADDGSIVRKALDGNRFTRSVAADGQYASMADTRVKGGANIIIFFRDNVVRQSTASGQHGGQPLAGYPLSKEEGSIDHEQLARNFGKRSTFPTGLALDIEIGGTGDNTARNDVAMMRRRTMCRKI